MISSKHRHVFPSIDTNKYKCKTYISDKNKGETPASWQTIQANPQLGIAPTRVNSSLYKGLMPCWEIIIAKGTANQKEALALSKKLKKQKISNYVKNAGQFVGKDSRLEKLCMPKIKTKKKDIAATLAISLHGHVYIPVEASSIHLERTLESKPKLKPIDKQHDIWYGKLPHKTIDQYTLGQQYTVLHFQQNAPKRTCSIDGFAVFVRGAGWPDLSQKEPSCGEEILQQKLSKPVAKSLPRDMHVY